MQRVRLISNDEVVKVAKPQIQAQLGNIGDNVPPHVINDFMQFANTTGGVLEGWVQFMETVGSATIAGSGATVYGGAATMTQLAAIGGVGGAVGGIIIVTSGPALLATQGLSLACKHSENDQSVTRDVKIGIYAGNFF